MPIKYSTFFFAITLGLSFVGLSSCGDDGDEVISCDESNVCPDDMSCLLGQCFENGTFLEGDTCTGHDLCKGDLLCGKSPFVCRRPCDGILVDNDECNAGEACKAVDWGDGEKGVCIPSECLEDDDCFFSTEACTKVSDDAGVCLHAE